ncbi:prolipoprotein diacylglyceryl transferase [Gammaproteobacteria bacterium]|nr:prolipoprotein diacylglyceryl transferase [Gammaproteobacteria bacterium]
MIVELSEFFNNPSLIDFGFIKIQYYAVTWVLSAVLIFQYLKTHPIILGLGLSEEQANDIVFLYGLIFGAMLGGRVGYMFFYGLDQLAVNPLSLFFVWEGGLSFHGGLIGVIASLYVYSIKHSISFLRLADAICAAMPIGLGLVRIGNFLNGELYGRPTDGSWGFIFRTDPYGLIRHPSQLYEALFEGVILFILLMWIGKNTTKTGIISGSFLMGYGAIRFFIEFFRQPDAHMGFITLQLSMGQLLSIPMFIIGLTLLTTSIKKA